MIPGSRREARERALELLYEADAKDLPVADVVEAQTVRPDPFAVELLEGIGARGAEIDGMLGRYARGWAVERMPVVDRAVLRMAAFELLARLDTPVAVIISEAVELAKRYSTEESGRFVNGVLASVARAARPEA